MDWATNEKHYTAFKLMEANDKIITMPNGNRIFDIREFNKILKNLDSWISVEEFSKNPKYFSQPSIHFMTREELTAEFDKAREEAEREEKEEREENQTKEEKYDL